MLMYEAVRWLLIFTFVLFEKRSMTSSGTIASEHRLSPSGEISTRSAANASTRHGRIIPPTLPGSPIEQGRTSPSNKGKQDSDVHSGRGDEKSQMCRKHRRAKEKESAAARCIGLSSSQRQ